jgi:hypothetical protein
MAVEFVPLFLGVWPNLVAPLQFLATQPFPEPALGRFAAFAATPLCELRRLHMVLRWLILILITFRKKETDSAFPSLELEDIELPTGSYQFFSLSRLSYHY